MPRIGAIFAVTPVETATSAAIRYVPLMVLTRGLAFVRFVLVAWLLGDKGVGEYGRYQLSLEIINFGVPAILLGLADVAERYAARFEHRGELRSFLAKQVGRIALAGGAALLVAAAAGPILGRVFYGEGVGQYHTVLILLAALNMGVLAMYQWTAASLRGLRAYAAAAGLEAVAAVLLIGLSCVAAVSGSAAMLLVAYAASNALPLAWYAVALRKHARMVNPTPQRAAPEHWPQLGKFAAWSLARLLLMMAFGLVSIGSVRWLATESPMSAAAEYALPYRIAQMLQYVAVMLWASSYGIATRAWAHGGKRRAMVTLLRTGKLGGTLLLVAAAGALICIELFKALVPAVYREPLDMLLPPMLAMFIWYGMLALLSLLGDLQEKPWRGAALWGAAVGAQVVVLLAMRGHDVPQRVAVLAGCAGVGVAAVILAPAMFWRPMRPTATAVPIGVILLAPLGLLSTRYVGLFGGLTLLGGAIFLWMTGLLIRPRDRRAIRRQLRGRAVAAGRNS